MNEPYPFKTTSTRQRLLQDLSGTNAKILMGYPINPQSRSHSRPHSRRNRRGSMNLGDKPTLSAGQHTQASLARQTQQHAQQTKQHENHSIRSAPFNALGISHNSYHGTDNTHRESYQRYHTPQSAPRTRPTIHQTFGFQDSHPYHISEERSQPFNDISDTYRDYFPQSEMYLHPFNLSARQNEDTLDSSRTPRRRELTHSRSRSRSRPRSVVVSRAMRDIEAVKATRELKQELKARQEQRQATLKLRSKLAYSYVEKQRHHEPEDPSLRLDLGDFETRNRPNAFGYEAPTAAFLSRLSQTVTYPSARTKTPSRILRNNLSKQHDTNTASTLQTHVTQAAAIAAGKRSFGNHSVLKEAREWERSDQQYNTALRELNAQRLETKNIIRLNSEAPDSTSRIIAKLYDMKLRGDFDDTFPSQSVSSLYQHDKFQRPKSPSRSSTEREKERQLKTKSFSPNNPEVESDGYDQTMKVYHQQRDKEKIRLFIRQQREFLERSRKRGEKPIEESTNDHILKFENDFEQNRDDWKNENNSAYHPRASPADRNTTVLQPKATLLSTDERERMIKLLQTKRELFEDSARTFPISDGSSAVEGERRRKRREDINQKLSQIDELIEKLRCENVYLENENGS